MPSRSPIFQSSTSPDQKAAPASEVEYAADLLADFGVPGHPSPEETVRLLDERYVRLFTDLERFVADKAWKANARALSPDRYVKLVLNLHRHFYIGILTNAGCFRKVDEPNAGRVWFGIHHLHRRELRFEGDAPEIIEESLQRVFARLVQNPDPVEASVLAFQQFLLVHPFYDTNGRVGRLWVTMYLLAHGYYVDWNLLQRRYGRFVQYLNHVHKRPEGDHSRAKHERLLVRFWRKHVTPLSEVYGEGQDVAPGAT